MIQSLQHISILVDDYDKAIAFYTKVLHFDLVEDTLLEPGKRWVLVRPRGTKGCCLLLAKAKNERQFQFVGDQTGGRVFLFLHTDNLQRDLTNLEKHNIKIIRPLTKEKFGSVVVFKDLFGNLWDLIEPNENHTTFNPSIY